MNESITSELCRRALAISLDSLHEEVVEISRQCVLDWLGVTLIGAAEGLTESLARVLTAQDGPGRTGSVIGRCEKLGSVHAALLNGTASHAIDYDDVNFSIPGHASAPVLAAALALGEEINATGRQILEAFIAGYETSCRIGALLAPDHYAMGFHSTATAGTFGATAACAKLLGLDSGQLAHALGIAATRAAGLKASFGTSCKPLQCGNAASAGVLAALLAREGFDAPADAIGHRLGFAATHAREPNVELALGAPVLVRDFSRRSSIESGTADYHLRFNLFKFHAACYETHSAIECALDIRKQLDGIPATGIESVRILVNPHCDDICNIQAPSTSLETKFSIRLAAAFGLAGIPTAAPGSFCAENALRPDIVALREKITVELTAEVGMPVNIMTATLKDGRALRASHDSSAPAADIKNQGTRLTEKFVALATDVLGQETGEQVAVEITKFETLSSVHGLMRMVTGR